ncbi:tryptophan--tRNA ligase [Cohaesibacter celericrescens]|uniref:Tryptophan--tRNA ligase n=1 Tax=Cohaesibacter celericrescens TaxID=2067669 RepID=A0A2N5XP09_9HYPH|nr:tryptophan--tRNA ligase [Cohaesibacter celericrescens]PLW76160.1 tryptophan--tRNA ligase [Cohaesibacter celericrescens]
MATFEPRVFSGIQPSGNLHLGNYLGAITKFVDLQSSYNCVFCVVDQHAITVWQDPEGLVRRTREVTAGFLASGIDPEKHIVFNQSQVAAHAQLAWVFNCVARMGWLNRMTQFKDKAGKNRENVSTGLFVYPNLMSADILIYKATHVPVGEDQKQHLELARDTAQKFNIDYAERIAALGYGVENIGRDVTTDPEQIFFPQPEPLIGGPAPRVMSLRDGSKKMSSSDASDKARINMTDDEDTIALKIRKAKTDPQALPSEVDGLEGRAEASNLVGIYAALSGASKEDVLGEYGGLEFSKFKPALIELSVSKLSPITGEMRRLMDDASYIDGVLAKGAERAEAIANPILDQVKDIVGFIRRK